MVGGILVGQSLIDSVRINRLVNDLRQYEVAVKLFKSKFKKYPGDAPYFIPPGTGNGILSLGANGTLDSEGNGSGYCATPPHSTLANIENLQVWAHLSQSQMLSQDYPSFSPEALCGGVHQSERSGIAPYTKIDSAATSVVGQNGKPTINVSKPQKNGNLAFNFYVSSLDALALQSKLESKVWDWSYNEIGLVRQIGSQGRCRVIAECPSLTSPQAIMHYFIPPI